MVPLRTSIGGVAKCDGDVRKAHAFTHKNSVINKRNKTGQKLGKELYSFKQYTD